MYAVIESGGKQYRVQPGDFLQVEKILGEEGSNVTLSQVLFFSKGGSEDAQIQLGKPYLTGATVQAEIVGQGRGEKILIVKMKRRKQYRRTQGHRQEYTQLLITEVANGAGAKLTLAADEKKQKLGKFQSHLKPRGLASTPKTLGSRVRMKKAAAEKAKTTKSA
ncbi:MAG: 50S ribosomal protein L21 [Bdellovibrio sp.]|nr:50S ribosomal protein L21 [Bdellovibrio sp.]